MIPASILLKTKPAEILINGVTVKTTVVENPLVAPRYLSEFRSLIQNNVVGFDVKTFRSLGGTRSAYGVLCAGGARCLVFSVTPEMLGAGGLGSFLNDSDICFVGTAVGWKVQTLIYETVEMDWFKCESAVEVGYFVSRVLMKGGVERLGVRELASALGMKNIEDHHRKVKNEPIISSRSSQVEECFLLENLKSVVEEAYTCFLIANEALGYI